MFELQWIHLHGVGGKVNHGQRGVHHVGIGVAQAQCFVIWKDGSDHNFWPHALISFRHDSKWPSSICKSMH